MNTRDMQKMKRTNISIPKEIYDQIKDEAFLTNTSISEVVRDAYKVYKKVTEGWKPVALNQRSITKDGKQLVIDTYRRVDSFVERDFTQQSLDKGDK